jgi:hypothetical protein
MSGSGAPCALCGARTRTTKPAPSTTTVKDNSHPRLIPPNLLFVWFGARVPLFVELALRSAATHNPNAKVVLLASGLTHDEHARLQVPGLSVETLNFESLLSAASRRARETYGRGLDVGRLEFVWEQLRTPAARANVVRLLHLFCYGGIYLDTDTLTLRNFDDLRRHSAFCGQERLLWPKERLTKQSRYFWLDGPALTVARKALANVPRGYRVQASLYRYYALAVNNAVLGCTSGHPAFLAALDRACALPNAELSKQFRLGTHLLQQVFQTDANAAATETERVTLLPPEYFYPLGPVISSHYFRETSDVDGVVADIVTPNTHVIHWYASVSNLLTYDATRILAEAQEVPFAHLCAPYLMSSQSNSR